MYMHIYNPIYIHTYIYIRFRPKHWYNAIKEHTCAEWTSLNIDAFHREYRISWGTCTGPTPGEVQWKLMPENHLSESKQNPISQWMSAAACQKDWHTQKHTQTHRQNRNNNSWLRGHEWVGLIKAFPTCLWKTSWKHGKWIHHFLITSHHLSVRPTG